MLNTCSIGRRWKPREGWSRPVLTGERGTLFRPACWVGSRPVVVSFVGWQGALFLVVTETIPVKRLVVRVRCPVPGPPRSESWHGSGSAGRPVGVGRYIGFAVVMAQVRRPVPFRTRKLRPGRGDGTALERVWESSTPPHSTLGVPVERDAPGTPFFVFWFVFPAARGSLPIHNIQLNNMKILGRALRSQGSFCISGQIIAIPANCPA